MREYRTDIPRELHYNGVDDIKKGCPEEAGGRPLLLWYARLAGIGPVGFANQAGRRGTTLMEVNV
jgi:hypothetical protein